MDFELAADYYENGMKLPTRERFSMNSYRCRRARGRTKFDERYFPCFYRKFQEIVNSPTSPQPNRPPRSLTDLTTDSLDSGIPIDHGGSSSVTLVTDPKTGKKIALKTIASEQFDMTSFLLEVQALSTLNHPGVLRIVGWFLPTISSPAQIHTEFAVHGSLAKVIKGQNDKDVVNFWNPTGKAILICGIILGMRYIHSKGIIHRDLKPSNILINDCGESLISDFGIARETSNDHTLTPDAGTVHYSAPELFDGDAVCTPKVDVYSFGLILYEILTGSAVFSSSLSPFEVIRKHRSQEYPPVPDLCGSFMQKLIPSCWSHDPKKRPSFSEIFKICQSVNFCIVSGADRSLVIKYVNAILDWERTNYLKDGT
jgi:serine/threonine protein kinase